MQNEKEIATVTLKEFGAGEGREVKVKITESTGVLCIRPEGYGDCMEAQGGIPVLFEVYDGELRCVIFGDINEEEHSHVISLEGAREERRRGPVADQYPNRLCPDCNEAIPLEATEGWSCDNCGHVFSYARRNDDSVDV